MDRTLDRNEDRNRERGAGLVEYVLLLALIAFVCIGALTYFGGASGNSVTTSKDCILAADGTTPTGICNKGG